MRRAPILVLVVRMQAIFLSCHPPTHRADDRLQLPVLGNLGEHFFRVSVAVFYPHNSMRRVLLHPICGKPAIQDTKY